jgi:hypothetical protein
MRPSGLDHLDAGTETRQQVFYNHGQGSIDYHALTRAYGFPRRTRAWAVKIYPPRLPQKRLNLRNDYLAMISPVPATTNAPDHI